eukprot:TRINITY_DN135201_c0_g1_i1.p1 TRINITY_DN135201_c0_g1~~TRINITY_DN135201_c0_g1_i1.p1  ORF type:complete len:470 (-),score=64.75 TRINITY_DN135201_c0_g1_i1:871-2280(-)
MIVRCLIRKLPNEFKPFAIRTITDQLKVGSTDGPTKKLMEAGQTIFRANAICEDTQESEQKILEMGNHYTVVDGLHMQNKEFTWKMYHMNAGIVSDFAREKIMAAKEAGNNSRALAKLVGALKGKTEEEKLALSKYAVDTKFSDNPTIQAKGRAIEIALEETQQEPTQTQEAAKPFKEAKIILNEQKKARKQRKDKVKKLPMELRNKWKEQAMEFTRFRDLTNTSGLFQASGYEVERYTEASLELQAIREHNATRLSKLEALVYKDTYSKDNLPEVGRIYLTDKFLYGKRLSDLIKKEDNKVLSEFHKLASKGKTPLEFVKVDNIDMTEDHDLLKERLDKDLNTLTNKFLFTQSQVYQETGKGGYKIKEVPDVIKDMMEPTNPSSKDDPLDEMDTKLDKQYSLKDVEQILEEFVYDQQDKGRLPPMVLEKFPSKNLKNDFKKWSRALGLDPILPCNFCYPMNRSRNAQD